MTGLGADSTLTSDLLILQAMSIVHSAKPSFHKRSATAAQPLLLGTAVRQRGTAAITGVVIAYASDSDRVRVRWDETGKVTHCLRDSLIARGVK